MSYFDDFKKRLNASGANESDAFLKSTQSFTARTFTNSPNFRFVKVDGVDKPVRLVNTNSFKTRDLLMLPETIVNVGGVVEIDNMFFLVTDFTTDQIISKARLTVCADIIKWYDSKGNLKQHHLVGDNISRFIVQNSQGTQVAGNYTFVYVQRNEETDSIVASQRFIIGGRPYSVMGIDNITNVDSNGVGLTQLTLTVATFNPNDDLVNGIADNTFLNEKDKSNDDVDDTSGDGGLIW